MNRIILLTLMIMAGAAGVCAQPKTVTDFFLAMPNDRYATDLDGSKLKDKTALAKFRRSLIKIEDVKNGYLRIEGAWEGWAEIALFKRKDGSYLIAESEVGCGPACVGGLKLSTYRAGKWTDVTRQFAPKVTGQAAFKGYKAKGGTDEEIRSAADLSYYFRLPREGKTLKIACNECRDGGEDFVLLEYEWNGEIFVNK